MTTTTDNKQALREYIESLGLTYQATFIPVRQDADKVKHPKLHWSITLTSVSAFAQFPYSEGCGHVKGYEKMPIKTPYDRRIKEQATRHTCETGRIERTVGHHGLVKPGKQPAPDVLAVLYRLVLDASVRHASTYEEWADEYGYDADSRKGEEIYQACQKQTTDFLRLLGQGQVGRAAMDRLEKLEELFRDY